MLNAFAVIERELRSESRRPVTHVLRVIAAAALFAVLATLLLGARMGLARVGPALFAALRDTLVLSFWVMAPLMTADCISREKREGTLGLLFLTPLRFMDVIFGKAGVHMLRAVTLFLAAVPILGLPFVFGGVGWAGMIVALVYLANAILLGIAAGIYSSVNGGNPAAVMVRAEAFALLLALVSSVWTYSIGGMAAHSLPAAIVFSPISLACSIVAFISILKLSAMLLKRNWQTQTADFEPPRWVKNFSASPFWQEFFYWNKSRTLDRNPVAWLQEYSWTARLTKWGWLLLLLFAEFNIIVGNWTGVGSPGWQVLLTTMLALGVAFSATGSFRRERETGLLEVMLVTPLSVRQLLRGRLWGIFVHYFGAMAVLIAGYIGDRYLNKRLYSEGFFAFLFPNPLAFLAVMMTGLYLSLFRLNFLIAAIGAWVLAFVAPELTSLALGQVLRSASAVVWISIGLELALIGAVWALASYRMSSRSFVTATDKSST
jgi:ABC-type transport system involved in multi-copper enzyme maturation permease subunit